MSDTASSVIDTGTLFLRHLTLDDTAAMLRLSQEQGARTWLPNQVYADEAQASEVLRFLSSQYGPSANPRHTPYVLGVCLSTSHELIGHVGFSPCEYGVEVGYAIGDAHQNRGYAKQAVFAATTWALSRFDLPFICAVVATENVRSCKVLESCGFQLLAVIRRKLHGVERPVGIYRLSNATCCKA
ncbi:MAG TPA: GNAT family N-acetyltransferase [Candidatus Udaeobacter sp.]|nr:GNAT family N-acetyltransferase [Candidatus Udaeobacter sp.]